MLKLDISRVGMVTALNPGASANQVTPESSIDVRKAGKQWYAGGCETGVIVSSALTEESS